MFDDLDQTAQEFQLILIDLFIEQLQSRKALPEGVKEHHEANMVSMMDKGLMKIQVFDDGDDLNATLLVWDRGKYHVISTI